MKPLHPIHRWLGETKNRMRVFLPISGAYFLSVITLATVRALGYNPPNWLIVMSLISTGTFIFLVLFVNWSDWMRECYEFEEKIENDMKKYGRERE